MLVQIVNDIYVDIDLDDVPTVKTLGLSLTGSGYVYTYNRQSQVREFLHRLLINCPIDMEVDHIDGNKLNNKKGNLRICTKQQNMYNRAQHKNKTVPYKGVSFCTTTGRYKARINKDKSSIFIGRFDTAEEAHAAYCAYAKMLYGNFNRSA